jgi:hypothetical protein
MKTKSIRDLTKSELLSLLYNMFDTHYKHPCICACCGDSDGSGIEPKPLFYLCDKCEKELTDD